MFASEQNRPDVARRRRQWRQRQASIGPARLVLIDETWTSDPARREEWFGPSVDELLQKEGIVTDAASRASWADRMGSPNDSSSTRSSKCRD